jgi:hypothetical protein
MRQFEVGRILPILRLIKNEVTSSSSKIVIITRTSVLPIPYDSPKYAGQLTQVNLSDIFRASMVTNMSPRDYSWTFSTRDYCEALWLEEVRHCRGNLINRSISCGAPESSDHALSSKHIRYDVLFCELEKNIITPYVGVLA